MYQGIVLLYCLQFPLLFQQGKLLLREGYFDRFGPGRICRTLSGCEVTDRGRWLTQQQIDRKKPRRYPNLRGFPGRQNANPAAVAICQKN